jgi:37-kD nucleoid-associated bacterial protein
LNLDSFRLASLVVHDVPQPGEERADSLILTDAEVPLDDQLRAYFERKITQSLITRGLEAISDPNETAVVRAGVASILADKSELVSVSKMFAEHLDRSQTKRNPAGLLAVGVGGVREGDVVVVLKLEREQGLRLRIDVVGDHTEVDLEFLRDLTLTDKTRIFKTSLLRLEQVGDPTSMYGLVSDDQRGRDEGAGVATFFLATFLGCQLKTNPEKATRDFVLAAEAFINQDVTSDERRATYQVALLAKLQDQSMDVRPRDFANASIEPNDRPRFLQRITEYGLNPNQTFAKDISRAHSDGFKIVFEHGMTLVGSREDLDQRVRIPEVAGTQNGVVINDTLKRIIGR